MSTRLARTAGATRVRLAAVAGALALSAALAACARSVGGAPPAAPGDHPSRGPAAGAAPGRPDRGATPAPGAGKPPPRPRGGTDPAAPVDFSLLLRQPGDAEVEGYLAALGDPAAPQYRAWLDAAAFGARFGLPEADVDRAVAWLASRGLELTARHPQRIALEGRGPAGRVGQLFDVTFGDFLDEPTGRRYHAPLAEPTVPAELADVVEGVADLSNRPPARATRAAPLPAQVSGGIPDVGLTPVSEAAGRAQVRGQPGLTPADLALAYEIQPLYDQGIAGQGQTVAIVSFDTFYDADIAAFDELFGIEAPPVERLIVDGGAGDEPGAASLEVTLDIQVARMVAPQAQILNYEAPYEPSQAGVIDAIVADGRSDIVTDSYGVCYDQRYLSPTERERGLRSLQAAAAQGVNVLVASGDWGAYDCWNFDPRDQRVTVDYPSCTPYTLAVGGTHLAQGEDGSYAQESGWEDLLSVGGTGGGLSPLDARPDWQHGPGVDNEFSTGNRQCPDVAAAADSDTGYVIYYTDPASGDSGPVVVGGTSASSPFWAGVLALFSQLAEQQGVGRLGFVNPMLYNLAAGAPPNVIFNDVTRGGNLLHNATPGWDYATGLGSPKVDDLALAVVDYLR